MSDDSFWAITRLPFRADLPTFLAEEPQVVDDTMNSVEFTYKVEKQYNKESVSIYATALKLSYQKISELDLSPVRELANLTRLSLQSNKLEAINLKPLESCKHLEELYLHDNLLNNIDLNPLRKCKNLKYINLNRNPLAGIDLSPLSSLKKLISLNLIGVRLSTIDLSPLTGTNIESLRLDDNHLTEIDLSGLHTCKQLTELTLANNSLSTIDLRPLPPQLRELVLYMNNLQQIDLEPLSTLYKLGVLRLEKNSIKEINLAPLWNSKLLHTLMLSTNELSTLDISALFNCSELSTLDIDKNVSLYANPDFETIRKIPEVLMKYRPRIKWEGFEEQRPYSKVRKNLIEPAGFESIKLKHLYLQLVNEINGTFSNGNYTSTMVLCRKLVENLYLEIILVQYKRGDAKLEEFYDRGRVNDFSKLIEFFEKHLDELTKHAAVSRRDLKTMISGTKVLNKRFNMFTHNIQHHAEEGDVNKIKDTLKSIIDTLILIIARS